MGLDMYLTKKVEIYKKVKVLGEELVEGAEPSKFFIEDNNERIEISADSISFDVDEIYWRKANAIHDWFVTHVQNGEDDCAPYIVYEDKLIELRDVCKCIIDEEEKHGRDRAAELADKLLPTLHGFFFGDTSYGDYYFDTVKETYDKIVRVTKAEEIVSGKGYHTNIFYEYRSAW